MIQEPVNCKSWNELQSKYSRHAEECEDYDDVSDGKQLGGCNHPFIYRCECGRTVKTDGYGISLLESDEHINRCYGCCGCDLCRKYTSRMKEE